MLRVKITLQEGVRKRLSKKELAKIEAARQHIEKSVNSKQYKDWCYSFVREYTVVTKRFLWIPIRKKHVRSFSFAHTDLSNVKVYEKLMSGAESINYQVDYEADINLDIDWGNSRNVLGYTYPNSIWQWTYIRYLRRANYKSLAGHFYHEWCHKVGFKHPYRRSFSRSQSVPYQHGYFVRDFPG